MGLNEKILKLEERINSDNVLQELNLKRERILAQIDMQIATRYDELRRAEGLIVNSINELRCEKHPEAKYEFSEEIKNSNGLKIYICSGCNREVRASATELKYYNYENASKAHDCPGCRGIVLGQVFTLPLQGEPRFGENYYCRICSTLLGENCWDFG